MITKGQVKEWEPNEKLCDILRVIFHKVKACLNHSRTKLRNIVRGITLQCKKKRYEKTITCTF